MSKPDSVFGTDGIRGRVGEYPMTVDFLLKVGWAVGAALTNCPNKKVLIGKDTRISGYMIESALEAGLAAAGAEIFLLGPMPTSGIAYLTRTQRAQVGIVISASHNPYEDNGVKFFSADGYKTNAHFKQLIEKLLKSPMSTCDANHLGKARRVHDAAGRYIEYCKSAVPHQTSLENLKIVVDCSNGATYHIAPHVFTELGARVITTHAEPDGYNINLDCGSNHPEVLRKRVLEEKADIGIAFDGDGDRVIMVDHRGDILNGDELLYIISKGLIAAKRFTGGVVGTQMSNMGLEIALNNLGIYFVRVPVGDHNIISTLLDKNWYLGGESSGHIMYLPVSTTADGIITALQVLQAMHNCQQSLEDIRKGFTKFPQRIVNIKEPGKRISLDNDMITTAVQRAETLLGKRGRVVLRHSGTEHVIRLMVEAESEQLLNDALDPLVDVITAVVKRTVPQ